MTKSLNKDEAERIKQNFPLLYTAERCGLQLKRASATRYVTNCCFHSEKTPSLTLDLKRGTYHCYGCDAHGDAINLYAHFFTNGDNRSAFKSMLDEIKGDRKPNYLPTFKRKNPLEELLHFTSRKVEIQRDLSFPSRIFKAVREYGEPLTPEARDYLHRRGLTDETIKHFDIFSLVDYKKITKQLKERFPLEELKRTSLLPSLFSKNTIVTPITEKGEIVALSGRYFHEGKEKPSWEWGKYGSYKYTNTTGVRGKLFNGDSIKEGETVYLTEGVFDCMMLHQNQKKAVALLGVSSYTDETLERLKGVDLIIAFDNDPSGKREALKVAEDFHRLTGRQAKREQLPKGIKDITELYLSRKQ